MSQEIKIGVSADVGSVEAAGAKIDRAMARGADSAKDLNRALDGAGAAAGKLDQAMGGAANTAAKMAKTDVGASHVDAWRAHTKAVQDFEKATLKAAEATKRFKDFQAQLSRELKRPVSNADAAIAQANFAQVQRNSPRARGFNSFGNWSAGVASTFQNQQQAAAYRRSAMANVLQGTSFAGAGSGIPGGGGNANGAGNGGGGSGNAGGGWGGAARKGASIAGGVVKGGLALAGIQSAMSMLTQAVGLGTSELIGLDTLKRRMGDLGINFEKLKGQAELVGTGLGITHVEAVKLATAFASTAGNLKPGDSLNGVRVGVGLARGYGLDPEQGVDFVANMRRMGGAEKSDQGDRKLALMIGDAVARSGYAGKADEIMSAVAAFVTTSARVNLSAPNTDMYAGGLTSLTGTGRPGLDPVGAEALLGRADSAVRSGGAVGEASNTFMYQAMLRANPGMDPVAAQALKAGGAFGTTRNTFGPNTQAGDYYRKYGIPIPSLDDKTTFEKVNGLLHEQYQDPRLRADAGKNFFGLQSVQQYMALDEMDPKRLETSQTYAQKIHLDIQKMSPTGITGFANIANANTKDELKPLYDQFMARKDVKQEDRDKIRGSLDTFEGAKEMLAKIAAGYDQEKTEGQETRDSIVGVQNTLTKVGGAIVEVLNLIRDGVNAVARIVSPSYRRAQDEAGVDFKKLVDELPVPKAGGVFSLTGILGHGTQDPKKTLADAIADDKIKYDAAVKQNGHADIDSIVPLPTEGTEGTPLYKIQSARRQALSAYGGGKVNPVTGLADPQAGTGFDSAAFGKMRGGGGKSRGLRNNNPTDLEFHPGQKGVLGGDNQFVGGKHNFGIYPDLKTGIAADLNQYLIYQEKYGKNTIRDMVLRADGVVNGQEPEDGKAAMESYIAKVSKAVGVGADTPLNLRDQETAAKFIQAVAQQEGNPISDADASAGAAQALGGNPLPAGSVAGGSRNGSPAGTAVQLSGAFTVNVNQDGKQVGTHTVRPVVTARPAGVN